MPIDPSIAMGFQQPKFDSPMNALAQVLQVQQAQQQNQLGTMKMDEYKRGVEESNALRSALSVPGADPSKVLLGMGRVKEATEYDKAQSDKKTAATTQAKNEWETASKKLDYMGQTFGYLKSNPTPEAAEMTIAHLEQNGILKPEQAAQYRQQVAADPTKIPQLAEVAFRSVLSAKDQLMKVSNVNLGGTMQTQGVDPVTGKPQVLGSQAITQSADNKASVGASLANAAATRAAAQTNAQATRDAAQINSNQNTEMKLGDDYRAQSKNFKETADAYKQITAVLDKATSSPAATLAGATKFMKMIDPGSVVRESELGMALAATGVFDRATNYFNTLQHGKVLTPSQVADFKNITKQINDAAATQQRLVDKHYTDVANGYKLRPEMVVQDFGQNAAPPVAGGGANIDALINKYSK